MARLAFVKASSGSTGTAVPSIFARAQILHGPGTAVKAPFLLRTWHR